MSDRGRPRHPDVLTPREWDVLTLVREGLSNPEIAERFGISRSAVKYHVSEILGKLELRSREEAAAWQPEPARRPGLLRPMWASAAGPIGAFLQRLPWIGKAALVGTAGAAVAGVVVLGVIIGVSELSGDDGGEDAVLQPSGSAPAAALTGTPLPTVTSGTGLESVQPLALGESTSLPSGWSMVLETGCYGCDGPPTGLIRVWRSSGGEIHVDQLFSWPPASERVRPSHPIENDFTPEGVTGEEDIGSLASSADGSQIALSFCVTSGCFLEGLDSPGPNPVTAIYRSLDGGVTWEELAQLPQVAFVRLILPDGRVLVDTYADPTVREAEYTLLPGGEPVSPADTDSLVLYPVLFPAGEIGWLADTQILDPDGAVIFDTTDFTENGALSSLLVSGTADGVLVMWVDNDASYLTLLNDEGTKTYTGALPWRLGMWLEDGTVVANNRGAMPAFIDLDAGELRPMTDPFGDPSFLPLQDRNSVRGVNPGPLLRVAGTGSCLNVREAAGTDQPVVGCVPDGVLVTSDTGATIIPNEGSWRRVTAPGGVSGWAIEDFLED